MGQGWRLQKLGLALDTDSTAVPEGLRAYFSRGLCVFVRFHSLVVVTFVLSASALELG